MQGLLQTPALQLRREKRRSKSVPSTYEILNIRRNERLSDSFSFGAGEESLLSEFDNNC